MAPFPPLSEYLQVGNALRQLSHNEPLLASACQQNPWFTPSMIREAVSRMLPWFSESAYSTLVQEYKSSSDHRLRVGLILAGNIPLVGFHDWLMTWLAGHEAWIKLSSKDAILLPALFPHLPPSAQRGIHFTHKLAPSEIDVLVATGSNNSSRYFAHTFESIPALIRHNRFSVAVLSGLESEEDLGLLAQDLLLYNGAGCRNISNLLVPKGYNPERLAQALTPWLDSLSPAFAEVLRWEKAVAGTLGKDVLPASPWVFQYGPNLAPAKIGVIRLVNYEDEDQATRILTEAGQNLQCIVGIGEGAGWGGTQSPGLFDFADGADTLAWLLDLGQQLVGHQG